MTQMWATNLFFHPPKQPTTSLITSLLIPLIYPKGLSETMPSDTNMIVGGEGEGEGELHLLMFPYLAFGHISPFLQLARKLSAADPTIRITILSAPSNIPRISSLLPSKSPMISLHPLPLPSVPGLPPGSESTADLTPSQAELLITAVDLTKPHVESLLLRLRPNFILFDFAQSWLPSIAAPLGIKTLFFSVFAAVSTAFLTVPSRRHSTLADLKKPPNSFPATSSLANGVPTYQAEDFTYVFKSFNGKPTVYDRVVTCITGCDAIVAKTSPEMEGMYIKYVESEYKKPMLLVGPVVPEPPSGEVLEKKWSDWLDGFGEGSVVFCSFGSETFLKDEAVNELLLGLEMTKLPFFVVLNFPASEEDDQSVLKKKVPEGMEERVKGRGVIHRGWVQQQMILRHRSVGCFVCHAGFSSVVEGVVAGCRLVMLPQRGDQYLNSAVFAGDLGVGVEVEREEGSGGFRREWVCEAVRKVMVEEEEEGGEGRKVRENHKKWREFLMDGEVQERFVVEFVGRLKALIGYHK